MNKLVYKIAQNSFLILLCNTWINCPLVKAQLPSYGCYMIDEFGGVIDLSSLCNSTEIRSVSNDNKNTQPPSPNQSPQENQSPANKPNSQASPQGNNTNTSTPGTQNTAQQERDRSQLPIIRKTIPIIDQQQQQIEENSQNKK